MSSRQLRRLGKEDLASTLLKLTSKPNVEQATETEEPLQTNSVSFNPFMLMGDDTEESENEAAEAAILPAKTTPEPRADSGKGKNKKKGKKSNKSKKKNAKTEDVKADDDEKEFDRLLLQFQKKHSPSVYKSVDSHDEFYDEFNDDDGFITADEESVQNGKDNRYFDLRNDPGFTKFKHFKQLYSLFESFDFKDLVPDNEFRLLFDDLSPESLNDIDSVTSTHVSPEVLKQIERVRRMVKHWSGKDKRSVPNGGSVRKLQFTKIRDDWLPTVRGELVLRRLSNEDIIKWLKWQRPLDWASVIEDDVDHKWCKHFTYYKFDALNDLNSKKALTEFYLSTILHPDHEALISLLSSRYPYLVPALLQVALICVRQGDKSNSNGLVEKALFVFDRCLKNGIQFNAKDFQLPYIHFYNRQFYLAIMRYIQIVSQRGAVSTAAQWCKALFSLSPLEDPLGVRYFMDHYLLANKEYDYIIVLVNSPLFNLYKQWFTLGLGLTCAYAYWKKGCLEEAHELLSRVWSKYPNSIVEVFTGFLNGSPSLLKSQLPPPSASESIELKMYLSRIESVWKDEESKSYLLEQLSVFVSSTDSSFNSDDTVEEEDDDAIPSPFFIGNIPVNLLRFAVLSQESSVMAAIPQEIWSDHSVFEFDVLPPQPYDRESGDVIETIENLIDSKQLELSQMERYADDELLQQINQLSLQEFIEQQQLRDADGGGN